MIPKVQANFNTNHNNSFQAKVPDRKLIVTCYDGKEFVVDKSSFDKYLGKNNRDNFFRAIKNIFFEFFPKMDTNYKKIMKTGK